MSQSFVHAQDDALLKFMYFGRQTRVSLNWNSTNRTTMKSPASCFPTTHLGGPHHQSQLPCKNTEVPLTATPLSLQQHYTSAEHRSALDSHTTLSTAALQLGGTQGIRNHWNTDAEIITYWYLRSCLQYVTNTAYGRLTIPLYSRSSFLENVMPLHSTLPLHVMVLLTINTLWACSWPKY